MARVWQRLGATVFFGVLVVGLSQCKGMKQKPGDKCTHNNMYVCADATSGPSSARMGPSSSVQCRGPKGCQGTGQASACDDDVAQVADPCVMAVSGANYACTQDQEGHARVRLQQVEARLGVQGPEAMFGDRHDHALRRQLLGHRRPVHHRGERGQLLVHAGQEVGGRLHAEQVHDMGALQGAQGLPHRQGQRVLRHDLRCRRRHVPRASTRARAAEDATALLKCSAQFKWTKNKDCKKDGCKVKGNEISCK